MDAIWIVVYLRPYGISEYLEHTDPRNLSLSHCIIWDGIALLGFFFVQGTRYVFKAFVYSNNYFIEEKG